MAADKMANTACQSKKHKTGLNFPPKLPDNGMDSYFVQAGREMMKHKM